MSPQQLKLSAFAKGTLVPIEAVPDPVFAGRMMGDGLAIEPSEGVLYAPCDGRIVQLQTSRHACILEAENGARILLHIGVDTVLLKGEGFVAGVAQGDFVRAGQALIEFDLAVLKRHGKPSVTILVIENGDAHHIIWRSEAPVVAVGDALLTLAPADATKDVTDTHESSGATAADVKESANGWAIVRHTGGMHARPCALLAHAVKPFAAVVEMLAHGKSANVRSATAIMSLAVGEGEEVQLKATGANAGDALEAAIHALETVTSVTPDTPEWHLL